MALARGSTLMLLFCLFVLVLHSQMAHAATYTVGDGGGWTFNTVGWPTGKSFSAGDTLDQYLPINILLNVFNYIPGAHNVVVVDKDGYDTCITPGGATVYRSGKDQITLARGQNYFICNYVGHCELGMKIAINAA